MSLTLSLRFQERSSVILWYWRNRFSPKDRKDVAAVLAAAALEDALKRYAKVKGLGCRRCDNERGNRSDEVKGASFGSQKVTTRRHASVPKLCHACGVGEGDGAGGQ